jgi:hypothetical protein
MNASFTTALQSEVEYVVDINKALNILKKDIEKIGGSLVGEIELTSKSGYLFVSTIIQFSGATLHEYIAQQDTQACDKA